MEQAMQVFMDYAAAFEQTFVDDDWSRLAQYFAEDAAYVVDGGPLACEISGRDAIFAGLKKSLDGLDRRVSDRKIEVTEAPEITSKEGGFELAVGWRVTYEHGDAPPVGCNGRSVALLRDGVIVSLRDEYTDEDTADLSAWLVEYGAGLDGSYV